MYIKDLLRCPSTLPQERDCGDMRLLQQAKRAREGAAKVKVGAGGVSRREAKLDPNKHRQAGRTTGRRRMLEDVDSW